MNPKKPHLLKVITPVDSSFILKGDPIPWDNPWHYHPELELILCIKGKGTNFVGNDIRSMEEGELLLLGANVLDKLTEMIRSDKTQRLIGLLHSLIHSFKIHSPLPRSAMLISSAVFFTLAFFIMLAR